MHDYGLWQGKDTNRNQPQGEMHSAESESIPNLKLLLSSGSITLPDSWQYATSAANQQCSPESWYPEFLLEIDHVDMID